MKIKNIVGHIKTILKHKWVVFKLCCRVGIPWRGLVHDLSKFSPTEFWESIKYYTGTQSPITGAKKDKGYSKAWLHHQGRNKHHLQYWVDYDLEEKALVVPYKYLLESICDSLAAGIVYQGKQWTQGYQYEYWMKNKDNLIINPKVEAFITEALTQVKENGIKMTLTKKNMKEIYEKYCIDDKKKYVYEIKGEWREKNDE